MKYLKSSPENSIQKPIFRIGFLLLKVFQYSAELWNSFRLISINLQRNNSAELVNSYCATKLLTFVEIGGSLKVFFRGLLFGELSSQQASVRNP